MVANFYKNFLLPVGLLSGTVIGAGMFSLPYIFSRAGFHLGFFYLLVLGLVMTAVHLLYARLVMTTRGRHNFVGFARIYLGQPFGWLAVLVSVLQAVLNLVIYLILSASFTNLLFPGSHWLKVFVFWLASSSAVFLTLKREARVEFLAVLGIVVIVFLIFGQGLVRTDPFLPAGPVNPDWFHWLLPLGPILFALGGRPAILELVHYLRQRRQSWPVIEPAVVAGTLLPVLIYGVFVMGILAITPYPATDAVSSLTSNVGRWLLVAVGLLGLINIFSSYLAIGFDVANILQVDLRFSRSLSNGLVIFLPMLLFLSGFNDFIKLVSLSGIIFGTLEIIFIIWMWRNLSMRS